MTRLTLTCCAIWALTGCAENPVEFVPVDKPIPESLLKPVPVPNRPLVTYRDAVVRDAERGAALVTANAQICAIAEIEKTPCDGEGPR